MDTVKRTVERPRYSSNGMQLRRQRILNIALKYLVDNGYEGLSTRKLAKQVGVSRATLFNLFETKENLLAEAVLHGFGQQVREITGKRPRSPNGLWDNEAQVAAAILRNPNFASAASALHFSESSPAHITNELRAASGSPYKFFLEHMKKKESLASWADPLMISDAIVNQRYSVIRDWLAGRIPDNGLVDRLRCATLLILPTVLRGHDQLRATELLEKLFRKSLAQRS